MGRVAGGAMIFMHLRIINQCPCLCSLNIDISLEDTLGCVWQFKSWFVACSSNGTFNPKHLRDPLNGLVVLSMANWKGKNGHWSRKAWCRESMTRQYITGESLIVSYLLHCQDFCTVLAQTDILNNKIQPANDSHRFDVSKMYFFIREVPSHLGHYSTSFQKIPQDNHIRPSIQDL